MYKHIHINIMLSNIRVFDTIKVEEISSAVNGYFDTTNNTTNPA